MALVSQREYARRRGVTHRAVQKAIMAGRIMAHDGKIDPAQADTDWPLNTDPSKPKGTATEREMRRDNPTAAPPDDDQPRARHADGPRADGPRADGAMHYAQSRAVREAYEARLKKLEYEREAGKLIDAQAAAAEWQRAIGIARNKVLGLPTKIRTRLPKLTPEDVAAIELLVRETLEELAGGDDGRT